MSISSKPRAHAGFMLAILKIAEDAGIDTAPALRANRISPDISFDADVSVSIQSIRNLYRDIARASGDDFFFWNRVQDAPLERFGYYGHLAATAPTVGDAFESLSRNIGKLVSTSLVDLEETGAVVTVGYSLDDDGTAISREVSEAVVAFGILLVRTALGGEWCPEAIYFEHDRPATTEPYRSLCDTNYHFNAGSSAISFDRDCLSSPMPNANIYLQRALENYVTGVIAKRIGMSKIALDVRTEIAARIRGGVPRVEDTAASLGMSPRTLQRRLREAGTSYSRVLEELRRDLAEQMLANQDLSVSEISYTLGYADTSSFDRAYRSWTGRTPVSARRSE